MLTVRIEHERHHSERVARHARNGDESSRPRPIKQVEAEARRNRQLAMQHVQQLKFAKVREARWRAHRLEMSKGRTIAGVVEKQRKRGSEGTRSEIARRKQQEMQGILKRK